MASPSTHSPTRGRLIVIEGLDRSGKSTQASLLTSYLTSSSSSSSSCPSKLLKFPDRTTVIGSMINAYLQNTSDLDDHVIHLLFSANRWELRDQLIKLLQSGTWVVLDRYVYSGIAFSIVKGLDEVWCRAPDIGLPEPDLILFLDVSEQVARSRGGFGKERYEKAELQKKVRAAFMKLFQGVEQVRIVDAGMSVEHVQKEIWRIVESELLSTAAGELRAIQ